MKTTNKVNNVSEYIAMFPRETQKFLKQMRALIKKAAPGAEEEISYQMPMFKLHGRLVYFAGYKKHIGFYPMASGIKAFQKEISVYKWAKGSVQFPLDKPLPAGLITKIVKYRVKENLARTRAKKV
jgi:uncharacterized protein YdhG (YjbR/CyaY superfamily)